MISLYDDIVGITIPPGIDTHTHGNCFVSFHNGNMSLFLYSSSGMSNIHASAELVNDISNHIEYIWAVDQNDEIISITKLSLQDTPHLYFCLPDNVTAIIAYAYYSK